MGVACNGPLEPKIFAKSDPLSSKKRRLQQISAYNVSTLRDSEKISTRRMESQP